MLIVDYSALNMDVAARKLQIVKCGCFTHFFNSSTEDLYKQNRFKGHPTLVSPLCCWVMVWCGNGSGVTVKFTFDLFEIKCHHFMSYSVKVSL